MTTPDSNTSYPGVTLPPSLESLFDETFQPASAGPSMTDAADGYTPSGHEQGPGLRAAVSTVVGRIGTRIGRAPRAILDFYGITPGETPDQSGSEGLKRVSSAIGSGTSMVVSAFKPVLGAEGVSVSGFVQVAKDGVRQQWDGLRAKTAEPRHKAGAFIGKVGVEAIARVADAVPNIKAAAKMSAGRGAWTGRAFMDAVGLGNGEAQKIAEAIKGSAGNARSASLARIWNVVDIAQESFANAGPVRRASIAGLGAIAAGSAFMGTLEFTIERISSAYDIAGPVVSGSGAGNHASTLLNGMPLHGSVGAAPSPEAAHAAIIPTHDAAPVPAPTHEALPTTHPAAPTPDSAPPTPPAAPSPEGAPAAPPYADTTQAAALKEYATPGHPGTLSNAALRVLNENHVKLNVGEFWKLMQSVQTYDATQQAAHGHNVVSLTAMPRSYRPYISLEQMTAELAKIRELAAN